MEDFLLLDLLLGVIFDVFSSRSVYFVIFGKSGSVGFVCTVNHSSVKRDEMF